MWVRRVAVSLALLAAAVLTARVAECSTPAAPSPKARRAETTESALTTFLAPVPEAPATPTPEPPPGSAHEVFLRAARDRLPVFEPTRIPKGFRWLPDEKVGAIGVVYGRGTDRIVVIEGAWDLGDPAVRRLGDADFGPLPGRLLGDVPYFEGRPGDGLYGRKGYAVLADFHGAGNYMVMGLGLTRAEILDVALSMERVK